MRTMIDQVRSTSSRVLGWLSGTEPGYFLARIIPDQFANLRTDVTPYITPRLLTKCSTLDLHNGLCFPPPSFDSLNKGVPTTRTF